MSNTQPDPIRPLELEEGSQYLLRSTALPQQLPHPETWERVRFVGYTACPAVVIVAVEPGRRMPIAREQLFSDHNQPQLKQIIHVTGGGR